VLQKTISIGAKTVPFIDFLLETLKICLPLFCEFVSLLVRTNCGFKVLSENEFVPINLVA
jgi:hypothetical protein